MEFIDERIQLTKILCLLALLADSNQLLMKELEENTIDQIRTLIGYLTETDLLVNREVLRCLDLIPSEHGGEVVDKNQMANPGQKPILLEQAYDEIKVICAKFKDESGATNMKVKTLLRELTRF